MSGDRDKYGAGEYAKILGVTTDNLRDWRRRGIGLGGAAVNGRVRYGDFDVVEGAVAMHVYRSYAVELTEAYRIANWVAPLVAERLGMDTSKVGLFAHFPMYQQPNAKDARFAFIPTVEKPIFTNDPAILSNLNAAIGVFVNIEKVAGEMPDNIKKIAKAV